MTRFFQLQSLAWAIIFIAPLNVSALSPETAQKVFNDLVHAVGDRKTQPEFRVEALPGNNIAAYSPLSNQIIVSPQFLDFAGKHGELAEAALALVIGHELAHHFENHNLRTNSFFAATSPGAGNAEQRKALEAEADYFAIFFAHIAGYATEGVDEKFIRELYAAFQIENNEHYPSLENRIEIFKSARQEIGKLVELFEAGNLLLTLGEAAAAAHCFEQVGIFFPSEPVWNNAGAAYLLAALDYLPRESPVDSLLFPVEFAEEMLHWNAEEKAGDRALIPEEEAAVRLNFLFKAKDSFERTLAFNDTSRAALANLTCTFLLLANEKTLASQERKLHQFNLEQTFDKLEFLFAGTSAGAGRIAVLKGIEAIFSGDRALAKRFFGEAAAKYGDLTAKINLGKITGEPTPALAKPAASFESLFGIALFQQAGRTEFLKLIGEATPVTIKGWTYELNVRQKSLPEGKAIWINYHRPELSRQTTFFVLQTAVGCSETSAKGIGLGSTQMQMATQYGLPGMALDSNNQSYWAYLDRGVMFCLSKGQVAGIFNFFIQEEDE